MKKSIFCVKGIGLFLTLLFLNSSCEKKNVGLIIDATAEYQTEAGAQFLSATKDLAKAIAKSMSEQKFSEKLYQELNKELGGDYQVFLKDLVSSPLRRSGIRDILIEFGLSKEKIEELIADPLIRVLATENTMELKEWNTQDLLVLISPLQNDVEYLYGYNSKGEYIKVPGMVEPTNPVLIIGRCEVCNDDGSIKEDYYSNSNKISTRARVSGNEEALKYIKCPDLRSIESWHFGKPELRFVGVGYRNDNSTTFKAFDIIQKPKRKTAKNGFSPNAYLFNWYFDDFHGPDYYIQAIEEDNSGTSLKLAVSVTVGKKDVVSGTATFEINYRAQDKKLYGQSISYRDSEPRLYSSSDYINFTISNE